MPVNRNALIRFKTLDNCFQNRHRKWTLEDLVAACSEALFEYEGIDKGVSKRTVQMDIQMMRSDKLGYNAPITVLEKKYYSYADPEYSITNIPLTDQDLSKLTEVVEILRQFKGFSHFQELSGMVQRLENKIYSVRTKQEPVIDFEKNEDLKGLEFIEVLYQSIIKRQAITLTYQSFKARVANEFAFHPYYLKEYRNRWFVLGTKKKGSQILTLALDRIQKVGESTAAYIGPGTFNPPEFFKHVIGVTVNQNSPSERVVLFADQKTAPYILTKPLHWSQQVVETLPNGVVFSINVQLNYELEREILGFGDRVKVIEPERLKRQIKERTENALDQYLHELSNSSLVGILRKLTYKGYAILNHVYAKKEVNEIRNAIHLFQQENREESLHGIRQLLVKIPALKQLLLNSNLRSILNRIDRNLFLTKAIFFDKHPEANWFVNWHQDTTISVAEKRETEGFSGWTRKDNAHGVCPPEEILKNTVTVRIHLDDTNLENGALRVVPGSHNKKLGEDEIQLITENCLPFDCLVDACGVQLMKPLLLHASAKATSQKHRRVVHLEFSNFELPNGLKWAERTEV